VGKVAPQTMLAFVSSTLGWNKKNSQTTVK